MNSDLQNKIDALEIYYESSGYENFYENELKCRTPEQINELYFETFGEDDW